MSTAAAHLCVCLFSNKSLFSPPSGQPEDDCSNRAISNLSEKPPEREPPVLYSLPLSLTTSNINQGLSLFWVIIKVALIFHANSNDCFYPLLKAGSRTTAWETIIPSIDSFCQHQIPKGKKRGERSEQELQMFSELERASGNFIFWKGDVKRRQHIHSSLSPRQLHITATQNDYYLIFELKNAFSYLQIESSLVVVEVVEAVSLTYPGFCTTGCFRIFEACSTSPFKVFSS